VSEKQPCRVIQWATGRAGAPSLRAIIERPDTELVGVYVSDPAKDGMDAGELCGLAAVGVAASNDADGLLNGPADIVSYSATDVGRAEEVVDDLCRILRAGKDLVTITPTQLFDPASADQTMVGRIQAACEEGGTSFCFTGIFPGCLCDSLIYSLTNLTHALESVTMAEMLEISSYDPAMLKALGFGETPEADAAQFPAEMLNFYWESILRFLATSFGIEFDEVRHFREGALAEQGFVTTSGLEIPAGTLAALHWGLEGVVGGERRICVEHYERLHADIAPEWEQPPGRGGYRFTLVGSPGITVDLAFHGEDPLTDAMITTANRAVNVLADVHAAAPGIVKTFLDLPIRPGQMIGADHVANVTASSRS
jgi:2,4-diaminopentanoate dehydrogenase